MKYYKSLDGVRGIAVMLVVLMHFGLLDFGWAGVELFFVLSGFLISSILLKWKEEPIGFYMKRFYWRRVLRIFPLYFGLLILATIAFAATGHPTGADKHLPYLYTYTFNLAIPFIEWNQEMSFHYLWSLSFEEQFYLVWPLVVYLLSRKALLRLCLTLVIISPLIRFGMAEYLTAARGSQELVGGMVYYFPFGQFDAFAIGGLIAVAPIRDWIRRPGRLLAIATGLLLVAGAFNLWLLHIRGVDFVRMNSLGYPVGSLWNQFHVWGYSVLYIMFAALLVFGIHPDVRPGNLLKRFLDHPWLVWIGKVSYGVYLFHWPLYMLLVKFVDFGDSIGLRLALLLPYLAVVFLISGLSFRYYESIFLRLKTRYFMKPPSAALPEQ